MCSSIQIALLFHSLYTFTKSQTVHDHVYITDLSALLHDAKENHDGIIYGNPLLTKQCRNALLNEHKYNIQTLSWKGFPSPWFWSRESLDATIRDAQLHRRLKIAHALEPERSAPWSSRISNDYSNRFKRMPSHLVRFYNRLAPSTDIGRTYADDYISADFKVSLLNDMEYRNTLPHNVMYYHIEKSGSSSIGHGILLGQKYNSSYVSENMMTHTECGFTFVREPISRFISAYYTINRLIYFHNLPGSFKIKYKHDRVFKWWNVHGEPQRVTTFVDDLMENDYKFVVMSPLEHIMTQTGILSVAQNDIHFVGRLDKLREHWHELYEFCDSDLLDDMEQKEFGRMKNYGVKGVRDHPEYAKMMGIEDYWDGDILPAYKAIADNYDLYHKIVQYYKQDFLCFGFEPNFDSFRQNVYAKWDDMMQRKNNT
eukprot:269594_1